MQQENPSHSTLDAERTDQLRTLLTAEATANTASISDGYGFARRRLLIGGVAATLIIGAGVFTVASNAGSPPSGSVVASNAGGSPSGPVMVKTACAVTIEKAAGGWTTLSIADINADPDAVVAELQAAGIEARKEPLGLLSDADGRLLLSRDQIAVDRSSLTMLGISDVGDSGLAGLTVQAPSAGPSPFNDGSTPDKAVIDAYMVNVGAQFNGDGSISIRNDADLTVIVLSEA
ncbi:MAG: hypothetical protein WBA45_16940 [Microthrixaceae bacterium]